MDNIKTGALVRELRKEKNMTQKELAGLLHVTDRAVSKWERRFSLRKGGAGATGRRPPLWGSAAAEYGCLIAGQENERGASHRL